MKLKIAIFVILASTLSLIGVMYAMINHSGAETSKSNIEEVIPKTTSKKPHTFQDNSLVKTDTLQLNSNRNMPMEPDEDYQSPDEINPLAAQDKIMIDAIASLSDTELANELSSLKEQIEKADLLVQLESKKLDAVKEKEAKATLERFALLGLEGTRRKYASIEPELKDAVYAHRDSLREIREMLSEY